MRLSTPGTFAVSIHLVGLLAVQGCHRPAARVTPLPAQTPPPVFAPSRPSVAQEPLPLAHRTRHEREAGVLSAMHKRVWARRASLPDIRRIASDVYPLICEAAQQAEVTPYLQAFARDNGLDLEQAREQWVAIEEADLLLEAGGNPDDISPAGASGVAQWMLNIAREQGLHIDFARSRQFTARIDALNWRIAWLTYLSRPDADQNLPSKPTLTPADFATLPALQQERETLREQRRQADDRFEPRKAVFAHARYLLRLYRKFPSKDWIFQAYHGGEWGAKKEIWFYLGQKPASYAEAIQSGNTGQRLTYEDVYFGITPHAHIPAFRYIYGRGDDHRHYWWKLRSAQEALALYHRDPTGFEQEWNRLLPGRRTEAVWYPDAPVHAIADLNALQSSQGKGLVPVTSAANMLVRPAPLDTPNAQWYAALQPSAKGALLLAVEAYKRAGGKTVLTVGDMTLTPQYSAQLKALHPPKPTLAPPYPPDPELKTLPGGGPPADFDYHTTGLAADILAPKTKWEREILEYALAYLEERQIVAVTEAKDYNEPRYHLVPNPRYTDALSKIGERRVGQRPVPVVLCQSRLPAYRR